MTDQESLLAYRMKESEETREEAMAHVKDAREFVDALKKTITSTA